MKGIQVQAAQHSLLLQHKNQSLPRYYSIVLPWPSSQSWLTTAMPTHMLFTNTHEPLRLLLLHARHIAGQKCEHAEVPAGRHRAVRGRGSLLYSLSHPHNVQPCLPTTYQT